MNRILYVLYFVTLFFSASFNAFAQSLEFMGLPIYSNVSQYAEVLTKHGFNDKYPSGDIAHCYWESGHFWTQRGCYVNLHYDKNNENKVELVNVLIPYSNFQNNETYSQNVSQLITDLIGKYGNPNISRFNMEDIRSTDYWSLYDHDHNGDDFIMVKWKHKNGELVVVYNNIRIWSIKLLYTAIERINKIKKSKEFKGQGKSDL